jgi:hypothetical protein
MLLVSFIAGSQGLILLEQFIAESIEKLIEDQAFSPSYDLAPPTPPPSVSELVWRHTRRLRK